MTISVDFNKQIGKIKPVNGVGQPPHYADNFSMFHYLKEANIPFSRLHDVGGYFAGNMFVDIPNIFRDFSADPCDPASYDFSFTDLMLAALDQNHVEPYFRLGITIENFAVKKAYRRVPPADFQKWAVICEHIIRHYTEGWANGFHYNIRYWEIWNEPDNNEDPYQNQMWQSTKEEFYKLYDIAAKHLKTCFPDIKIGGYSVTNFFAANAVTEADKAKINDRHKYFIAFFDGFLDYIKAHNSPIDFFSWHSYDGIEKTRAYAEYCRNRLDEAGYAHIETSYNEWHFLSGKRGSLEHAALNTANLIEMQHSPIDNAMFYDARITASPWGGMFNPMTWTPLPLYYGFKAFGELYVMGTEVDSQTDNHDVYVLAATDGDNGGILIVNLGEDIPFTLDLQGQNIAECRVVTRLPSIEGGLENCECPTILPKNSVYYIKTQK